MTKEQLWRPDNASDEGIYARSPLTASEETMQFVPGSRLLSTTEFKRVYLGGGNDGNASTVVASGRSSSPANATLAKSAHSSTPLSSHFGWSARVGSSHVIHAPRRPTTGIAARFHRQGDGSGTARQLRHLYGSARGSTRGSVSFETHMPSFPQASTPRMRTDGDRSYDSKALMGGAPQPVVPASVCSTHKPLPHQLRSRVRLARRASSPAGRIHSGTEPHLGQYRTEDAWLELTRELMNTKDEVQSLQRRLRHAHVLLRSLHGVTGSRTNEDDDAADVDAAAVADIAASRVTTDSKPTDGSAEVAATTQRPPHPREFWQRRAYFLMKRNEELQAESDRLRCDSRGSRVHALLQELKSVRGELSRYRRQAGAATALSASANVLMSKNGGAEDGRGSPLHGDGKMEDGPAGPRLVDCGDAASSSRAPAADDSFLREKDATIGYLRERLRLLAQQYQKTDAGLVATARRLEDMMQRHRAALAEWEALTGLPQELSRTQQQLAIAQVRLLDSDRELEAFRQLFDTQASPATLRAVVDERDHLVELLRQSQQGEAALRDEMKAAQQQLVRSVEKKYRDQYAEEQAMSRDRDAQHEETVQMLRKQVAALQHQLEVQREEYEAQLAERTEARETEMTQRLLESVRRSETGTWSAALSASRSLSAGALSRPTSPERQLPTTADIRLASGGAPLHCPSPENAKTDPMLRTASFSERTASSTSTEDFMTGSITQDDVDPSSGGDAGKSTLSSMSETVDKSTGSDSLTGDTEGEATSISSATVRQARSRTGDSTACSRSERRNEYVSDGAEGQQPANAAVAAAETDETTSASTCSSSAGDSRDSEGDCRDEETVEKANGSFSLSSVTPTLEVDATTRQPRSSVARTKTASASTHTYIMGPPAPPLAVVSPVSILINRTSTGALFPPNMRPVVHSPEMSSQGTVSVAEHTHTQQMLTGNSETKSGSDYLSDGFFSSSSSPSSLSLSHTGGDDDGSSAPADPNQSEPHDGSAPQVKQGDVPRPNSSTLSGTQALTKTVMRPLLPVAVPHVASPLLTFPAEWLPPPLKTEETVEVSLSTAAQPANERRSSVSLLGSAAASGSTTLPNRGVLIPSTAALTPAVDSNSYPPRRSSSCLLVGGGSDDDFGGAAGASRGGTGSRLHSNDHNTSSDFTNQYSGNASFDFAGLLAERHRLEDMQNALSSSQRSSVATAAVSGFVGKATSVSSSETIRSTSSAEHALVGTGAAGLRKTPSPPLDSDIVPPRKAVLSTCDGQRSERQSGASAAVANTELPCMHRVSNQGSSSSLVEVSYEDDDDDDTASSISSRRVTAVTRERQEMPLADAPPFADPADCARGRTPREVAFATTDPVPGETIQSDLHAIANLGAPSSVATALSHAGHINLSSISKTLTQEENTVLSFGFEDGGEVKSDARDVESAPPPSDTSAAAATAEVLSPPGDAVTESPVLPSGVSVMAGTAAPPFVPSPPRVSVSTAPRAALPSPQPPPGPVPLPPRVAVPLPPSAQAHPP